MKHHTIAVTGGAGFIGSNFIRLMRKKHPHLKIHNIDCLTYAGNLENLADVKDNPNDVFHRVDITNETEINRLFEDHSFDLVVHFAAESHVDRSILSSRPFVLTNVVGTQVLLDAAKAHNVGRFIHVSTDEVYGSLGPSGKFKEDTPIAPNSPYSASKAGADLLVRSYIETHHFPASIVRCSNNYGPYQFPEKLIPLMTSNALHDQPLPVYGTGQNVRDWIYVEDFCRGIESVILHGRIGSVYNFGGEAEVTNLDMVKMILKELKKPESLIKFVTDRPGHDFRYAMDFSKATRELGWLPEVSLEEGLQKTISWYQQNTAWWENIKTGRYLDYYRTQYAGR